MPRKSGPERRRGFLTVEPEFYNEMKAITRSA
jgi:hypothetical protein